MTKFVPTVNVMLPQIAGFTICNVVLYTRLLLRLAMLALVTGTNNPHRATTQP